MRLSKKMSKPKFTEEEYETSNKLISMMDQDGDGNLDPFEFHSILIEKGILIPLDVVTGIFKELDEDGNGILSCDEFTPFMFYTKKTKYIAFCTRMWTDWDWWFIINYFLGGLMYILAAFHSELGLTGNAEQDLYLAGIVFYNLGTTRYILPYLYKKYKAEENFEKAAVNIQEELNENAEKYNSSPTTTSTSPNESPQDSENSTSAEASEAGPTPLKALHPSKEEGKLELYMREVVFSKASKEITKTELDLILLKEVGIVAESVLDRIFKIVDDDESGKISVDEFISFLQNWKPELTDRERLLYVFKKSFTDWAYILTLVFLTGGMFIMLENVVKRFNPTGLWDHDVVTPGKVGAYCYTIGSTIFVVERFRDQSAKYDMEEIVRDMLAKLITKLDEAERLHSETKEVEAFNDNIEFDQTRFDAMLEDNGIFIPKFQVKALFDEIDKDGSDTITKDELVVFAKGKRNKILTIIKQSFTNLLFMVYLFWDMGRIVGSAAFIVLATANDPLIVDVASHVSFDFWMQNDKNLFNFCMYYS